MPRSTNKNKKTAQDIQDDIFRKMPADRKVELWAKFWELARILNGNKPAYGTNRSSPSLSKNRRRSQSS